MKLRAFHSSLKRAVFLHVMLMLIQKSSPGCSNKYKEDGYMQKQHSKAGSELLQTAECSIVVYMSVTLEKAFFHNS